MHNIFYRNKDGDVNQLWLTQIMYLLFTSVKIELKFKSRISQLINFYVNYVVVGS